jgi:short-subunit dehydrogenase
MNFNDKTILITGASSGIGAELVRKLSKYSCELAILARRMDKLEEIAGELKNSNAQIYPLKCDVTDKQEVKDCYKNIKSKFGKVDLTILNSGVSERQKIYELDYEYARQSFEVNLFGIVNWVEEILPDLMERRSGVIAGVSSLADNRGFSGSGFYSASKAAATIFLEGLRVELKPFGIKVITIKPGFVKTPMTDKNEFKMPFLMNADKAAGIILKKLEKEKEVIQFPLPTVIGSKLIGMFPSKFYSILAEKAGI